MESKTLDAFKRLSDILDILREECPWDRAQTLESLRYLTIEEVYELSEAITHCLSHDVPAAHDELKKELGDILMHIFFYAKIAEDRQMFTLEEVSQAVSDKLVSRHPHLSLPDRSGVRQPAVSKEHPGWEQVKMKEGRKSVLEGVPSTLPPLVKAVRMQEKAAGIGYFQDSDTSAKTLTEQAGQMLQQPSIQTFGDYLFQLIRWADTHGINADDALTQANQRFQNDVLAFEQRDC